MPMSLRAMIKKLAYKGSIDSEECEALLEKLDGHDRQLREDILKEVNANIGEGESDEKQGSDLR